jgi:hypothetical protein
VYPQDLVPDEPVETAFGANVHGHPEQIFKALSRSLPSVTPSVFPTPVYCHGFEHDEDAPKAYARIVKPRLRVRQIGTRGHIGNSGRILPN